MKKTILLAVCAIAFAVSTAVGATWIGEQTRI